MMGQGRHTASQGCPTLPSSHPTAVCLQQELSSLSPPGSPPGVIAGHQVLLEAEAFLETTVMDRLGVTSVYLELKHSTHTHRKYLRIPST